jgi:hypothetical protein
MHPDGFVVRFATTAVPKGQRDEVVSDLERLGARPADLASNDPSDAPTHLITPVCQAQCELEEGTKILPFFFFPRAWFRGVFVDIARILVTISE